MSEKSGRNIVRDFKYMNTTEQSLIPLIDKNFNGEVVKMINSRDLYKYLEIKTPYSMWIKKRIDEYDFIQNKDWLVSQNRDPTGTQIISIDYFITIVVAKELAMLEKNDKGKEIRKYFIACEEKLKELQKLDIPSYQIEDPVKRAEKWIEEQKEKQVLQLQNQEQQKVIEIQKPKADYFDALVDRNLLTNFRNTAKEFKIHQNELIDFLIQNHYIFRDAKGILSPYQKFVPIFFEIKEWKNFSGKVGIQTLITPRGRETFRLLMRIEK